MSKDLRTYLEQLHSKMPDHLKVVEQEVDPKWEVTAIVEKLKRELDPIFPGIFFTNVKGSNFPLLINVCGSYERLALSIDTDLKSMVSEYLACCFTGLLGPTKSNVQAALPSGILRLCLSLCLLKPI